MKRRERESEANETSLQGVLLLKQLVILKVEKNILTTGCWFFKGPHQKPGYHLYKLNMSISNQKAFLKGICTSKLEEISASKWTSGGLT